MIFLTCVKQEKCYYQTHIPRSDNGPLYANPRSLSRVHHVRSSNASSLATCLMNGLTYKSRRKDIHNIPISHSLLPPLQLCGLIKLKPINPRPVPFRLQRSTGCTDRFTHTLCSCNFL